MENTQQPTEEFLRDAMAALDTDSELRLEVAAELRSHLEDKIDELCSTGMATAEADEHARRAMGSPHRSWPDLRSSVPWQWWLHVPAWLGFSQPS